jgi:hypothetical protein
MSSGYVTHLMKMYDEFMPYADPRSKNWLLLNNSPIQVWCLTIAYLVFVWLGPKVMKNRPAFNLQKFMFVYNMALVGLSAYMFVEIILSCMDAGYGFLCATYNEERVKDPKELRVANVLWWYFFSKAIELNDTVLMVLRKKTNQITFLHVFHHATMLNIWWWVMMFIPGGLSYFGSCLNCLVHVIMYSYYGLSVVPQLNGKLWWKRYITRFQLIQFCITFSHSAYSLTLDCDFPPWGQYLLSGYMVLMLVLFTNFYIHAYIVHQRKHATSRSTVAADEGAHQNGIKPAESANGYATADKRSTKKKK